MDEIVESADIKTFKVKLKKRLNRSQFLVMFHVTKGEIAAEGSLAADIEAENSSRG